MIDTISIKMKEVKLGPDEIIFNSGDQSNRMYFIIKG